RRGGEIGALRRDAHRHEAVAVLAARRAAGRGAGEPLQKQRERGRAGDVGVLDGRRLRNDDARDAFLLHALRCRLAVELLPDDVARRQQLPLLRQRRGGCGLVLRRDRAGACERVGKTRKTLRAQLDRVDEIQVQRPQGARRADLLGLRVGLLLLLCPLLEARHEVGLLEAERYELVREFHAEPLVARRERPHLVPVALVVVVLALALARA